MEEPSTIGARLVEVAERTSPEWLDESWVKHHANDLLVQLNNKGCPRRYLLPFLNWLRLCARVDKSLPPALRRRIRRNTPEVGRKLDELAAVGARASIIEGLSVWDRFFRQLDGPLSRDAIRTIERYTIAHLVLEIEIRTSKHHDQLTADLLSACVPGFGERATNTQVRWRRDHRHIVVDAARAGLRAVIAAISNDGSDDQEE